MNTKVKIHAIALALTCSLAPTLKGQIYVVNTSGNSIGEYGLNGVPINSALVTGLNHPQGITVIGNDMFVVNQYSGSVAEYTTSGSLVNGSLISSGLNNPWGLSSSGGNLYVANQATSVIDEYNTSGSLLNAVTTTGTPPDSAESGGDIFIPSPVSGVSEYNSSGTLVNSFPTAPSIFDMAILGNDIFIPSNVNGTIGEYTLSGQVINATLITGLDAPEGLAITGNDLYVVNDNKVGEYTLSGQTINSSLITGLNGASYIDVVPEPSTMALAGLGTVGLWFLRRRK
jgi:flagellar basal body rod protein FlgG